MLGWKRNTFHSIFFSRQTELLTRLTSWGNAVWLMMSHERGAYIDLYQGVAILIFTLFQLIVTKMRLDEIIVWCHVCAMNVSIHCCCGNREHDQDGDSVITVYWPNERLSISSWQQTSPGNFPLFYVVLRMCTFPRTMDLPGRDCCHLASPKVSHWPRSHFGSGSPCVLNSRVNILEDVAFLGGIKFCLSKWDV